MKNFSPARWLLARWSKSPLPPDASADAPPGPEDAPAEGEAEPAPLELPLDGVLDLHTFRPRDVPSLLDEWLRASSEHGIRQVRIIHGKGTGVLRARVHALLRRHPLVQNFRLAGEDGGGWGATLAELKGQASEKDKRPG